MISKTRVAHVKKITLPRLQLMTAVITARLCTYVEDATDFPMSRIVCWKDNSLTLHCIRGTSLQWKRFVANRVREIQSHCLALLSQTAESCLHIFNSPKWIGQKS